MNLKRLLLIGVIAALVAACGPAATPTSPPPTEEAATAVPETPEVTEAPTEPAAETPTETPIEIEPGPAGPLEVSGEDVEIMSADKAYGAYLVGPTTGGPYPGIVMIHSINGLEEGYRTMADKFAAEGFVIAAIEWQTYERTPPDDVVKQLTLDTISFMAAEGDVDLHRMGLTGFCAGGRYTMLLLPQIKDFNAGVAWYGFPYRGDPAPAALIGDLDAPMLVIHGTADSPSPIADIYKYTDELKAAGKDYELKVYDNEPHGFMLQNGQMRTDEVGMDAFNLMVSYFKEKLGPGE